MTKTKKSPGDLAKQNEELRTEITKLTSDCNEIESRFQRQRLELEKTQERLEAVERHRDTLLDIIPTLRRQSQFGVR